MPFGTGNDIGRSLGWGRSEDRLSHDLQYLAESLVEGKREKFALWEVEFHAKEAYGLSGNQRVRFNEDG
jgi:diacylglycerol kinase family enzyme